MSTFKENLSYGLIKEIGENDVLISVNGQDFEIELDDSTRRPVYDAASEGIFIVPVDVEKKKLLINVNTQTVNEIFPEGDLKELQGVLNPLGDEYE